MTSDLMSEHQTGTLDSRDYDPAPILALVQITQSNGYDDRLSGILFRYPVGHSIKVLEVFQRQPRDAVFEGQELGRGMRGPFGKDGDAFSSHHGC
jgi:hypothetical protein